MEEGGYGRGGEYGESVEGIIEENGLEEYEKVVMEEMEREGKGLGREDNGVGRCEN